MPGYKLWGYDICIRLYKERKNWFDASEECGKGRGYLFTLSIDPDISIQDLNSSFDFEFPEMWLGGYRNIGRFQWLAFYPNIINTSKEVRIYWGKDEPILDNDCLSGEMKEGNLILYSRGCHEKKSFLCMHKFFRKEYLPHRCPKQWKSWPSVKNCYKDTNNSMTWKDAGNYCKNQGGRLATLNTLQVNSFVKNYISQHGCNDWWIGLRRTKHGFIWENNEIVRYVDWDRNTKFDFNNTAGYLKCNGYNMSWSLDNPNKKKMGICEMEMNRGRVRTKLEKVSDGVFKCSSNKRFYKSVAWYKDGIIVRGSRGLMNIDDDYLNLTENLLYTNKILEKGHRQGYYWCEIYQEDPFVSVTSNKMLFTYKNIWTFSGEFISLKIFNHLDPSTLEYWNEAVKIGERIEKYLLSKLKFQSAVYVNKLSRVSQKTKVEFLIYFQVSIKKSSRKKIDKEVFMKKLRNFMISNINSTLVMKNLNILPESLKIRNTDGCFREITEIEGQTLTWPRKYFGEIALPEENCITANQPFSGCMPGYKLWGYDICIRLYKERKNWFDASEECGKGRGYLFTLSIDPDISIQDLNSSFDFEFPEMWLGGYRNIGRFQWLAFYPNIINTSKEVRIYWGKDEPILDNDCLSGEMKEGNLILYSRGCHEKKSFLCMHKFFRKEYLPHRCPKQWKSWPSVKNCYKDTNNSMTWKDAGNYCKNQGGRLATLNTLQIGGLDFEERNTDSFGKITRLSDT
ncbi:uncharacterized protein LOC111624436 [Centruroides sculpturatus]|uniref:uncharacterized protein LOC111624436 n=1 Tax=Centruroides sculpturatus TaxID=218467 RepID=UPI000C6CA8A0|nr:uncharacterized protein LOC111624436 [Centruroides sculpturatus]